MCYVQETSHLIYFHLKALRIQCVWFCFFAQVWAIGFEDRAVYFRQGVTASELSGKTWRVVSVSRDSDRSHSSASANSLQRLAFAFTHSHNYSANKDLETHH